MKINITENSKIITLSKVKTGEVFYIDGDLYIKIIPYMENIDYNVVDLSTGRLYPFDENTNVTIVEATLDVKI